MNCLEFATTRTDEYGKREVALNCCPGDFFRLRNTPELCGGKIDSATEQMCLKCWGQEAKPDASDPVR